MFSQNNNTERPKEGSMSMTTSVSPATSTSSSSSQNPPVTFKAFLDKMRHPAAADLVRSIKNFIQDMLDSSNGSATSNPDAQSESVQRFLEDTEMAFMQHPLWRDAREEELEAAGEGLEKYLMTKLHDITFGVTSEDKEQDEHLSALLGALKFVTPDHLDIPERVRKTSTYTMAMKELNKINSYKAPRDKLVCIMNCCYIINNLLGVATKSGVSGSGEGFGADDFLPILIFVVIHAGVDKLESNLQYIQRFRKASRLSSEAAYFYTNVMSATSFISTVNADSLTIDKKIFIDNMRAAGIPFPDIADDPPEDGGTEMQTFGEGYITDNGTNPNEEENSRVQSSQQANQGGTHIPPLLEILDQVEKLGIAATATVTGSELRNSYSYIDSSHGDLRISDISGLLVEYKELALKHERMVRGLKAWHSEISLSQMSLTNVSQVQQEVILPKEPQIAPRLNDITEQVMSLTPPPSETPLIDLDSSSG